jgi:gamma-glutamylcyclotransferase
MLKNGLTWERCSESRSDPIWSVANYNVKLYYFAYGSNMCTGRLRLRVPSAKPIFVTQLSGHVLRFHKRSTDGSGKADSEFTGSPEDFVWGVVFEIDSGQKPDLDRAEGLGRGYEEKQIILKDCTDQSYRAWMYFASESHKNAALRPYSWYLRFVVEGAKQHGLPSDYIALLEHAESAEDRDAVRDAGERSISCR